MDKILEHEYLIHYIVNDGSTLIVVYYDFKEPYRFAVNFDAQSMSQNVYGTASNPVLDHVSFPVVNVGPQTSEWEIKETWRNCILSEVKKVNTFYQ